MEESFEMDGKRFQVGHTKEYVKIALQTDENLQNQLTKVRIDDKGQIIH